MNRIPPSILRLLSKIAIGTAVFTCVVSVTGAIARAGADDAFDLIEVERDRILEKAEEYLGAEPETVASNVCERSEGTPHDFYSEGDYWWPNPEDPDGAYIRRDGETNPANFVAHRKAMVQFSDIIGTLTSAYIIVGKDDSKQAEQYAAAAVRHLKAWFVDGKTRMNPSLLYGQAIKGKHSGRSIGIIDTIHLCEVARGAKILGQSNSFAPKDFAAVKQWFADYLNWINSHEYGLKEKLHHNNHGVCWSLQAAAFADLVGDEEVLAWVRNQFKTVYLAEMMNDEGGFPEELARTKPYGYSLFVIDAMAGLAQIASTDQDNLWAFELPDKRGMKLGMQFIVPFIKDKSKWKLPPDVQYWDEWPVRHPSLLLGGIHLDKAYYVRAWQRLEADPKTFEVLRNLPLRHPLLWTEEGIAASTEAADQHSQRLTDNWLYVRGDLGGIWEVVRPAKPGKPETVPLWTPVTLPHCFNASDAVDPDVNYYQGPGWYKTNLAIEKPNDGDRKLLHFEGAGQKTQVYIYTTKVGEHVGGYDEWSVDITDVVAEFLTSNDARRFGGKVPIAIRCDNSRDLEMIPSDLSDFNVYGGLYRYVSLRTVPATYLDRIELNTSVDLEKKSGTIDVKAMFAGDELAIEPMGISLFISDPNGKVIAHEKYEVADVGEMLSLGTITIDNAEVWSPEKPNLYQCEVMTSGGGARMAKHAIGFRHTEWVKKGPFKLNGERLLLRGTHRHEDHAGVAAAMTEEMLRKEMQMMKDMGINFIRLGHYQQSRIVLDLCDELGMLVWEEIPWCRGGLGGEVYQEQARRMLGNMIAQHRNHPSVFIWGLGNENDWPNDFKTFAEQPIRDFMSELNDLAHELDPSRKTAIRRCNFCKDIVDIYSPSIWAGWYRGKFTDYQSVSKKEMEDVDHFLHVEWGASNHARRHSEDPDKGIEGVTVGQGADERDGDASMHGGAARVSKDGDWTETYACNLIDWHLKEQERMPWLTGTAYWPFKDFSTPVRPENPVPYVNQKGVIERDFEKKEGYFVFQSYWTEKPMARIYSHSWPVRWGDKDEKKLIKVYSNCPSAELFVNGENAGTKKRDSQDFPAAGLRWHVKLKPGDNHLRVVATKDGLEVVDEIDVVYQTEKWDKPAKLKLTEVRDVGGMTEIEAVAYDKNGVRCLDAMNEVQFDLAGDGELVDNLGTSRGSRKVQLYNGRALIRVINEKRIVVSVESAGLKTGFLTLNK